MPFQKMQFLPGFYTESTKVDAANRYIDGDKTRFFKGFPKKLGGSVKVCVGHFLGICRGIRSWVTLSDIKYIALGTHLKLYLDKGGTFFDITPIRISGTLGNNPITTTSGSPIVTMHHVAHGNNVGDYVTFSGATVVGSITVSGTYTVTAIIDVDNYTITALSNASANATGGGAAVTYSYEIHVGSQDTLASAGWGVGTWGQGTWGTGRTSSAIGTYARTWSGSNYGEDLVFSPRDQAIYIWLASSGVSTRAVLISAAPPTNKFILVSPEDRYIISFGAYDAINSVSDPMLIRWSSQDDYNDWTPSTINTAGDKRLSEGNLIMCAVATRGQIIISTDTTIYSMSPDSEFVFAFRTLGVGGCISPNGMVEHNGIVYWIGSNNFYMYDGNINILECDVRSYVFDNLDLMQAYKIYAWVNTEWNEIWWFYQDINGTECNRYVCRDYQQLVWHYGSRNMTAAIDRGVVSPTPIATSANRCTYALESGVDEDGSPMLSTYTTGSPQDHNRFSYIKKVIINFKTLVGNMGLQFKTSNYPQSTVSTSRSYTYTSDTPYICPRIRGDEFSMVFTSNEIGADYWGGETQVEVIGTGSR